LTGYESIVTSDVTDREVKGQKLPRPRSERSTRKTNRVQKDRDKSMIHWERALRRRRRRRAELTCRRVL